MRVATLNKDFQFGLNSLLLKVMPSETFIAREKSVPGFQSFRQQADLLGANGAGDFIAIPQILGPLRIMQIYSACVQ